MLTLDNISRGYSDHAKDNLLSISRKQYYQFSNIVFSAIIMITKVSIITSFNLNDPNKVQTNSFRLTLEQFGFVYTYDNKMEQYNIDWFWTFYFDGAIFLSSAIYLMFLTALLKVCDGKIVLERKLTRKIPVT
tara:strand:- start:416 stop:814 length:399 start_codon:yes stop_codon:yes gene_type:complete